MSLLDHVSGSVLDVPEDDDDVTKPLSPSELSHEADQPATVGWVKRWVRRHYRLCPAVILVRRFVRVGYVVMGFLAATQIFFVLYGRTIVREAMREAMRDKPAQHAAMPSVIGTAHAGQP